MIAVAAGRGQSSASWPGPRRCGRAAMLEIGSCYGSVPVGVTAGVDVAPAPWGPARHPTIVPVTVAVPIQARANQPCADKSRSEEAPVPEERPAEEGTAREERPSD